MRPQGAAYHTKTTSLGTFRDSQSPCLCFTYTIKSAVSYLSSRHHYQRHNPGTPFITHSMKNPMKKSAHNSTFTKTPTGARSLIKMVVLVLFSIISPAHGISHSRAFHMMLTKCRSPNTKKESFILTTSLSSIARGQRSYLISQTVLQDQALSVSMNQSAHIAGQSLVFNLRSNQISSGLAAHLMCRNNFEDAIQNPVDLPSQITRYQNALKYARTNVDYVFGFGLYMAPSNMELRIGTIQGYNNKIILSTHD